MRSNIILLLAIALMAVLAFGFLALNRDPAPKTTVQQFAAIVHKPTSTAIESPNPTLVARTTPPPPLLGKQTKEGAVSKAEQSEPKPPPAKTTTSFDKNGIFTLKKAINKNGFHKGEDVVVVVDKGSHFTYILQKQKGDKVVLVHRASNAIGTEDTPTSAGPYTIVEKTKWPAWVPPKSIDSDQKPVHPYNKDRKNPLGVARIRLDKFGVALHGTNNPGSIRQDASHGCIRHSNKDITKIFNMVEKGDAVVITEKFVGTKISKDLFEGQG